MDTRPFIPVPNAAQVVMQYQQDGQIVENVLRFEKSTPYTVSQMQDLAACVRDWYDQHIRPLQGIHISLNQLIVFGLDAQSSPGITFTNLLPMAGTQDSAAAPASVALCITWHTALRGASFRGRTYLPGFINQRLQGNRFNEATVTAATNAGNALISESLAAGHVFVIVSFANNKAWRTTGVTTEVETASASAVVRTQRRRLPA